MAPAVTPIRFLLQTAWIIPVIWLMSPNLAHGPGPMLTPLVYVGFGLAILFIDSLVPTPIEVKQGQIVQGVSTLAVAVAAALVIFGAIALGMPDSSGPIVINGVLLLLAGICALRVFRERTTFGNTTGSFRFGIFAMVILMALIYFADHNPRGLSTPTYLAAVGYALLGVLALAATRRFSTEGDTDERGSGLDADWLLALVLLLGALSVVGLVLIQLLGVDLVGQAGSHLKPAEDSGAWVMTKAFKVTDDVIAAVKHLLGIHTRQPKKPLDTGIPRTKEGIARKRTRPAGWVITAIEEILKVGGIILAGAIALGVLAILLRRFANDRVPRVSGESRFTNWSWGAMAQWLLHRTRDEFKAAMPSMPRFHRRSVPRTVRDVYRAFLSVGHHHGRPRARSQTGLEYGDVFATVWPGAIRPVANLNELYMQERYGARPVTDETLAEAREHLAAIETATKASAV